MGARIRAKTDLKKHLLSLEQLVGQFSNKKINLRIKKEPEKLTWKSKYKKLCRNFGLGKLWISAAKCKFGFVYIRSLLRPILKWTNTGKRTASYLSWKFYSNQKQNALNFCIEETVHTSDFTHGEFLARLLNWMRPSFLNISQKLLITPKKVNEMFLTSKCTFKNFIFFTIVFHERLKILKKFCRFKYEFWRKKCPHFVINGCWSSKEDCITFSSLTAKSMQILRTFPSILKA